MFKHSTPVPTDAELNHVHPAPAKLLCPELPADKMYHLVMKEKLWTSWSSDSHGIKYLLPSQEEGDDAKPMVGRDFEVDIKGKSMSLRDRMVVQNSETGEPFAVILKMHMKMETTLKVYVFEPCFEGQKPSDSQKHDDRELYEWASCKDKFFSVQKTMKTADGVKYVMDGVGGVFSSKRQMRITRDKVPCMHAKERTLGIFAGSQWDIRIGPGIDPALMVAFMAIMDEMSEEM